MDFSHVLAVIWLAVGATITASVVAVIRRYARVLIADESHIKNVGFRDALEFATREAESAAERIVVAINQDTVGILKSTGKWDAAAAAAVQQQALNTLNTTLSSTAKAVLDREVADVPAFLSALVESAVATAPNKMSVAAETKSAS